MIDIPADWGLAGLTLSAFLSATLLPGGSELVLLGLLALHPDEAWPAVWLERDDDTGFQQVLERADYLAKEHTKAHCTGERNFGCSRS